MNMKKNFKNILATLSLVGIITSCGVDKPGEFEGFNDVNDASADTELVDYDATNDSVDTEVIDSDTETQDSDLINPNSECLTDTKKSCYEPTTFSDVEACIDSYKTDSENTEDLARSAACTFFGTELNKVFDTICEGETVSEYAVSDDNCKSDNRERCLTPEGLSDFNSCLASYGGDQSSACNDWNEELDSVISGYCTSDNNDADTEVSDYDSTTLDDKVSDTEVSDYDSTILDEEVSDADYLVKDSEVSDYDSTILDEEFSDVDYLVNDSEVSDLDSLVDESVDAIETSDEDVTFEPSYVKSVLYSTESGSPCYGTSCITNPNSPLSLRVDGSDLGTFPMGATNCEYKSNNLINGESLGLEGNDLGFVYSSEPVGFQSLDENGLPRTITGECTGSDAEKYTFTVPIRTE